MRLSKFGVSLLNLSACLMAGFLLFAAFGARAQGVGSTASKTSFEKPVVRTIKGKGKKKRAKISSKDLALPTLVRPVAKVDLDKPVQRDGAKKATLQNQPANALVAAPAPEAKKWSAMVSLSRSTSLYDQKDGSRRDSGDVYARLGLKVTDNWGLSTAIGHSTDLNNSEYSDFGDVSFGASRKAMKLGTLMSWTPSLAAIFPTSKSSQVYQNMLFAAGGTVSVALVPEILPENLTVGFAVGLTRLVHQYEENSLGGVNTEWSSRQSASVGYSLGRFSLSAQFIHRNSLSYQGTLREGFDHTEDLSYQASDNLSVSIGHSLSGSALRPNGQDSNLALVNENDSTVYGSLTVSY